MPAAATTAVKSSTRKSERMGLLVDAEGVVGGDAGRGVVDECRQHAHVVVREWAVDEVRLDARLALAVDGVVAARARVRLVERDALRLGLGPLHAGHDARRLLAAHLHL